MDQALERAIEIIGGPAAVGRLFDPPISSQAVSQWERAPINRVLAIERATQGKVTCEELRPDVDWAYLRGTAKRCQHAA